MPSPFVHPLRCTAACWRATTAPDSATAAIICSSSCRNICNSNRRLSTSISRSRYRANRAAPAAVFIAKTMRWRRTHAGCPSDRHHSGVSTCTLSLLNREDRFSCNKLYHGQITERRNHESKCRRGNGRSIQPNFACDAIEGEGERKCMRDNGTHEKATEGVGSRIEITMDRKSQSSLCRVARRSPETRRMNAKMPTAIAMPALPSD